mgnify:CR=1 FL=1
MEYVKLTWKCKKCGDIQISYSNRRHDMQVCKCGCSGVDLEEGYQRNMGSIEEIKREVLTH